MSHRRHHLFGLLAAWLFSAGFVLVSSGWGPALSRLLSGGPNWSVCGQALCDCRPVDMPDDCPLCLTEETNTGQTCSKDRHRVDPTRLLIRRSNSESAMTRLDSASQTMLVGCFLIGLRSSAGDTYADVHAGIAPFDVAIPRSTQRDVPTPPPRA
ncbi:MAG: hypothetical protein AAGA55_09430 [Planctomycetota bacterium]